MPTIFSKIIAGEIPCYKVYEDFTVLAFLDIFPVSYGHVLVIPKAESKTWLDMKPDLYIYLQKIAFKVGIAMQKELGCKMVGQMIDGREVAHTHIHLIPLVEGKKLNETSIAKPTNQEFKLLAEKIAKSLDSML